MGRKTQYKINPEIIEELYDSCMPEDAKNIWLNCVLWVANYFGCSKQLADIRVREWDAVYNHHPMKTVGLDKVNTTKKEIKHRKVSEAMKRRFADPVQKARLIAHLREIAKNKKPKKKKDTSEYDKLDGTFEMPEVSINKTRKIEGDIIV